MNSEPKLKSKIFVSFAHEDKDVANVTAQTLSNFGIPVWIDHSEINPGSEDWQEIIHQGLENSLAMLLLASPSSRKSGYVRSELELASGKSLKIFPLWIDGEEWHECAPVAMIHSQYVDARNGNFHNSLTHVCNKIKELHDETLHAGIPTGDARLADCPEGYFELLFNDPSLVRKDKCSGIFFRCTAFSTVGIFLDYLYKKYLIHAHAPMTYGKDWFILKSENRSMLAPWIWLGVQNDGHRGWQEWHETSLVSCGLLPGSRWFIGQADPKDYVGIATYNKNFLTLLMHDTAATASALSSRLLEPAEIDIPIEREVFHEIAHKNCLLSKFWPTECKAVRQVKDVDQMVEHFVGSGKLS